MALLAAILDIFTCTTSDYIGAVDRGWRGATKWWENTLNSYTFIIDQLVLEVCSSKGIQIGR